jgi:DNA polymerase I
MTGLSGVRMNLVESLEDAWALKRWLGERRPVLGFDTETGGLEWWRVPLRLVQVGDEHTGWAVPWGDWAGLVKEIFREYEGDLVAHNAAFDVHMLEHNGVKMKRELIHDTSVMAHIDDSARPRALKSLAEALVDKKATLGQEALHEGMAKRGWTWETVPVTFEPYWVYGALDPVLTCRMHSHLRPRMAAYSGVYDLEMALLFICMDMEARGFRVDLDYTKRQAAILDDRKTLLYEQVWRDFGVRPGSNDAVADRLIRDGIHLIKTTAKGKWSTDEEVLSGIADRHPLAQLVLDYRQTSKFHKTYFTRILDLVDGDRIHASLNPLGARTARMSVSAPPLQQLPSDSPLVRDCFIASEGNTLGRIDFDQIEVRLLAHFAQEPDMIHAIRSGIDMHNFSAEKMYGPGFTKKQRKMSKSGTFGKIYGIGADKFAVQQGVTTAEAQVFLAMYDQTFPAVPDFIQRVEQVGRQRRATEGRAYVTTPIGRRHYLHKHDDGYYKLVNYLIQGTAADVLKQKLITLDAAGFGPYLTLPVHDEIIFDVPEAESESIVREALALMQDHTSFAVPLSAGAEIAPRWGDGYREAA